MGCQVKPKPDNNQDTNQVSQHPDSVYTYKTPHPDGIGKVYLGREIAHVMSAAGGEWLERNTRQQEENVALAISKLNLSPNSVVADIGAGTGYYTFRIAPKVPQGKVYAVEVQDEFISALENRKKELGLANVEVIKGSNQSPNLPEASVDLAIMVDVYHELEYPQEMLQSIHKALKPTGKLLLLEYQAEDPTVQIKELHKMSITQVNKELELNNFKLYKRENFLPIQHFMLYNKAQD
ncbi:class I SAM-dependent methyltransferase [Adhaeribacter rhizoryzae]|uniref:class I SAM-dependent methyltransferase n=1 Tax=Adhaeribacter rhizoryzae TaxID=2607907 RepID=UPI001CC1F4F3|nr:class I SAM-dependent methyltransferase [Adhaeribacter rhizoryzae]